MYNISFVQVQVSKNILIFQNRHRSHTWNSRFYSRNDQKFHDSDLWKRHNHCNWQCRQSRSCVQLGSIHQVHMDGKWQLGNPIGIFTLHAKKTSMEILSLLREHCQLSFCTGRLWNISVTLVEPDKKSQGNSLGLSTSNQSSSDGVSFESRVSRYGKNSKTKTLSCEGVAILTLCIYSM